MDSTTNLEKQEQGLGEIYDYKNVSLWRRLTYAIPLVLFSVLVSVAGLK